MPVKNRFAELLPEITEWRRDFHMHPELMFDTERTGRVVAEKLTAFGCDEVVTGIAKTGVVGVIKGKSTGSGKVIGLRADMDALPINEATGAEHASTIPGKMHACGHDGHTSMLLGAAKYLAETRNFDGTVVVIFQPAEEGGGGGKVMCDEGMMDKFGIQEVYGMHNWPGIPTGQFAIRSGAFFASADQFTIHVKGKGAHAAKPNDGIDPIVMASNLVAALQSVVSRNVDPVSQAVLSVTSIESDSKAYNVIPQQVELRGTVRTLDPEVRLAVRARIEALATSLCEGMGGVADVEYEMGYPVMVNHETQTEFAAEVAKSVSGSCDLADQTMGGEDFAYMLEERPGAYILVGNGDTAMVHHPEYDFNDEAIPAGCSWWAEIVEQRMPA